ncbi:MAG: hypothetical protein ACR2PS_11870 [Pseudomonadales bacterium]
MQAQNLNTELKAQGTKAASTVLAASCKFKRLPVKAPAIVSGDRNTPASPQGSKPGSFDFAGIAG